MTEEKKRVNVLVPLDLHKKVTDLGYGLTEGIIAGLELLITPSETPEIIRIQDERIQDMQEQLKVKDAQIAKLTDTMQAQSVHLQTLINQKAIEAPGAKKPWWRFW